MTERGYSQRSEGPTVDALELKVSGSVGCELDLRRTQEVEVTLRGIITGHTFGDKRDRDGNVIHTVKASKLEIDELVDVEIVHRARRRPPGQTSFTEPVVDQDTGEVVDERLADGSAQPDAAQIGTAPRQLNAGDPEPVDAEVIEDPDPEDASSEEAKPEQADPGEVSEAEAARAAELAAKMDAPPWGDPPQPVLEGQPDLGVEHLTARLRYLQEKARGPLPVEAREAMEAEAIDISRRIVARRDAEASS